MKGITNATEEFKDNPKNLEQLVNYTMLYDYGNECTDITGGWYTNYTQLTGSVTKNSNNITIEATKGSSSAASKYSITHNTGLDLTNYNKVIALFSFNKTATPNGSYRFSLANSQDWVESETDSHCLGMDKYWYSTTATLTGEIAEINIPSNTTLGYIHASSQNNATSSSKALYTIVYLISIIKPDNYNILAQKINIAATSIDEILANSEILLNNENAVEYMIRQCTGDFMAAAIQNSTFLTALSNSPYASLIYANEHWAKFLNMVV